MSNPTTCATDEIERLQDLLKAFNQTLLGISGVVDRVIGTNEETLRSRAAVKRGAIDYNWADFLRTIEYQELRDDLEKSEVIRFERGALTLNCDRAIYGHLRFKDTLQRLLLERYGVKFKIRVYSD